ncbi:MAG: AI-2E family transporter [Gammaproteobacteria bacterium]|nr:AI-2E family transporter [Gammaproteobacteria bacterium]
MFDFFSNWYRRYFTHPQAAVLVVLLAGGFIVFYFMGSMLAPMLAAVVLAYLLEAPIQKLTACNMPRFGAVALVFLMFVLAMGFITVGLLPILSGQASQFFQELPGMLNRGQELLLRLPERYPGIFSAELVTEIGLALRRGASDFGQELVTVSVASIPAIITVLVYLILVPLMIFFFLKDKDSIRVWLSRFLPSDRSLVSHLWGEMDAQIGNYIRGKVYEIAIIGATSYIVFKLFGLNYAFLLSITVGLSVLIPYIGAAVVTLPVALVAYFQWGFEPVFIWLVVAYFIIQFLDGNILVPLLFSDAVNLHPLAIIIAILVFGGLWGFWGVFFAIPLATLVKALINVWPTREEEPVS